MRHKKIAYTASFGMLWGLSELLVGSWLHMLHIPFRGSIMTVLGVWIILMGLKFIPGDAKGSLIGMGLICASVKFLSMGMVPKPNIYISIVAEAALAEGGIFLGGRSALGYMLAGGLALLWPPFSRLTIAGIMLGGDYIRFIERIGLGEHMLVGVIIIAGFHILFGAGTGYLAWRFKYE